MDYQHKNLAAGRWFTFSFLTQMANVGGEVSRALNWQEKNPADSRMAVDRALELLDLTIADPKNQRGGRGKELWRVREMLADFFYGDNEYKSSEQYLRQYFDAFGYAANLQSS